VLLGACDLCSCRCEPPGWHTTFLIVSDTVLHTFSRCRRFPFRFLWDGEGAADAWFAVEAAAAGARFLKGRGALTGRFLTGLAGGVAGPDRGVNDGDTMVGVTDGEGTFRAIGGFGFAGLMSFVVGAAGEGAVGARRLTGFIGAPGEGTARLGVLAGEGALGIRFLTGLADRVDGAGLGKNVGVPVGSELGSEGGTVGVLVLTGLHVVAVALTGDVLLGGGVGSGVVVAAVV
jgi:hypothetical protein